MNKQYPELITDNGGEGGDGRDAPSYDQMQSCTRSTKLASILPAKSNGNGSRKPVLLFQSHRTSSASVCWVGITMHPPPTSPPKPSRILCL
jgi:hypothetical protein